MTSERTLTAAEVEHIRGSAEVGLHRDKIGMSENLMGPFPCPCFECAKLRNIMRLCDQLAACQQERDEAQRERDQWKLTCEASWTALDDGENLEPDHSLPRAIKKLRVRTEAAEASKSPSACESHLAFGVYEPAIFCEQCYALKIKEIDKQYERAEAAEAALAKLQALRPELERLKSVTSGGALTRHLIDSVLDALPSLSEQGTKE